MCGFVAHKRCSLSLGFARELLTVVKEGRNVNVLVFEIQYFAFPSLSAYFLLLGWHGRDFLQLKMRKLKERKKKKTRAILSLPAFIS